jgi:formate-dependent nitrite reductase membrane component NrfD
MIVQLALEKKAKAAAPRDQAIIRDVMAKLGDDSPKAKRVYDSPSKGILWGWEVSAYIWTKGIASGTYLMAMIAMFAGIIEMTDTLWWAIIVVGLGFLLITGILLVKDLDRPERFLYVILRPNWSSWLVKGAYILGGFGGVLSASAAVLLFDLDRSLLTYLAIAGIPLSALTGVYTAWLFQQAKARSWAQDNLLPLKFLIETVLIGSAVLAIIVWPQPLVLLGSAIVLGAAFVHGKEVVQKPQLVALS